MINVRTTPNGDTELEWDGRTYRIHHNPFWRAADDTINDRPRELLGVMTRIADGRQVAISTIVDRPYKIAYRRTGLFRWKEYETIDHAKLAERLRHARDSLLRQARELAEELDKP